MVEYQPFQKVEVIVIEKLNKPGMYWVRIAGSELEGQLVCVETLKVGEQLVCQFAHCDEQGRIVFCMEFAERQRLQAREKESAPEEDSGKN